MICLDCHRDFALETALGVFTEEELEAKYEEHLLWHHPSEQDTIDLYHDIDLKWIRVQKYYHEGNYVQASLLLSEISTDALRYKKYIDLKLGEE